jgi:hypothetical protein
MKLQVTTLIIFTLLLTQLNAQVVSGRVEVNTKLIGRDSTQLSYKSKNDVYIVSMIRLIATPEKYHDKEIIVSGYLNLQFEGNAIYIHKQDYENGLTKNGLWVNFSEEVPKVQISDANGKYVMLRGTFDMERTGHFGLWSGTINKIVSVTPLPKRE